MYVKDLLAICKKGSRYYDPVIANLYTDEKKDKGQGIQLAVVNSHQNNTTLAISPKSLC